MTTKQNETPRLIAERLAAEHIGAATYYAEQRRLCADAIEAALKDRDERVAKIVDKYIADMRSVKQRTEYGEGCLNAAEYLASQIRGKKTNAD